jgi:DNA-binding PadR family transcriptional regulator
MPVKLKKVGNLVRGPKKRIASREEPPLGSLQAMILKKMDELGDEAFGYKVLEELMVETGEWFDPSLVYGTIRKMADKQRKFIEHVGRRRSPDGGPPLKIYRVTAAGRAAIKATAAYHRALADFLDR